MARRKIRGCIEKLILPQSVVLAIEHIVKPENDSAKLMGFLFKHCEQSDSITSFCALAFSDNNIGEELSGNPYIYSHYSAHSHPSYLGVKHFEEMYPNKEEDKYVKEILAHACKYLGHFMEYFCEYKDSYRPFYVEKEIRIKRLLSRISQD